MTESTPQKQILISAETYRRLQSLAEPFVDTVDTVISRLLDEAERTLPNPHVRSVVGVYQFDPFSPPPLRHTRVEAAFVQSREIENATWNGLLVEVLRAVTITYLDKKMLGGIGDFNCVEGVKTDAGYKYFADLGISIQGQDSNGACRTAFQLAKHFGLHLAVHFSWRNRPDAAHPGIRAFISYDPADA